MKKSLIYVSDPLVDTPKVSDTNSDSPRLLASILQEDPLFQDLVLTNSPNLLAYSPDTPSIFDAELDLRLVFRIKPVDFVYATESIVDIEITDKGFIDVVDVLDIPGKKLPNLDDLEDVFFTGVEDVELEVRSPPRDRFFATEHDPLIFVGGFEYANDRFFTSDSETKKIEPGTFIEELYLIDHGPGVQKDSLIVDELFEKDTTHLVFSGGFETVKDTFFSSQDVFKLLNGSPQDTALVSDKGTSLFSLKNVLDDEIFENDTAHLVFSGGFETLKDEFFTGIEILPKTLSRIVTGTVEQRDNKLSANPTFFGFTGEFMEVEDDFFERELRKVANDFFYTKNDTAHFIASGNFEYFKDLFYPGVEKVSKQENPNAFDEVEASALRSDAFFFVDKTLEDEEFFVRKDTIHNIFKGGFEYANDKASPSILTEKTLKLDHTMPYLMVGANEGISGIYIYRYRDLFNTRAINELSTSSTKLTDWGQTYDQYATYLRNTYSSSNSNINIPGRKEDFALVDDGGTWRTFLGEGIGSGSIALGGPLTYYFDTNFNRWRIPDGDNARYIGDGTVSTGRRTNLFIKELSATDNIYNPNRITTTGLTYLERQLSRGGDIARLFGALGIMMFQYKKPLASDAADAFDSVNSIVKGNSEFLKDTVGVGFVDRDNPINDVRLFFQGGLEDILYVKEVIPKDVYLKLDPEFYYVKDQTPLIFLGDFEYFNDQFYPGVEEVLPEISKGLFKERVGVGFNSDLEPRLGLRFAPINERLFLNAPVNNIFNGSIQTFKDKFFVEDFFQDIYYDKGVVEEVLYTKDFFNREVDYERTFTDSVQHADSGEAFVEVYCSEIFSKSSYVGADGTFAEWEN